MVGDPLRRVLLIIKDSAEWRARNSSRILVNLSSSGCWEITESVGYSELLLREPDSNDDPIFAAFIPPRCPTAACPIIQGRGESPFDLYQKVASSTQPSFLLESGKGENRTLFIFWQPPGFCHATTLPRDRIIIGRSFFMASAHHRFARHRTNARFAPFFGGAVGCFSYDFVRRLESVPAVAVDDLSLPDMHFALYEVVAAVDHQTNRIQVIFCPSLDRFLGEARDKLYREGLDRLAEWEARLTGSVATPPNPLALTAVSFGPQQTQEAYLDRVRRCQEYIAAGDIYQANLSHRFGIESHKAIDRGLAVYSYEQALYRELRAVNPSPFSGLLRFGDMSLISSSPERLVRLQGAVLTPDPSPAPDRAAVMPMTTAVSSANCSRTKRNGRSTSCWSISNGMISAGSARFGSVQVNEFMAIEQYSHVSHIVSNISGTLRPGATPFDLISATFPGGTITGVPKIRCMEIIEELEPVRRGPYTGSFGYIGWNGDLDLNIIIRTLVMTEEAGISPSGGRYRRRLGSRQGISRDPAEGAGIFQRGRTAADGVDLLT